MDDYRKTGASSKHQSWFCSWNHPRTTWVSEGLCKMGSKITNTKAEARPSDNRMGDAIFFRRTLTGDETWIHHDAPESKHQSMETSDIASQKDVQNSTIGKKYEADILVGCTRANFGTLPREGYDSKQCKLQ
jgi:hypothetical protein